MEWHYCSCNRVLQHLEGEETIRHTSVQSPLSCSKRTPSIDKQSCCRCYSNITKTAAILRFNLSSQPVPDSGKQIKVSFMTRRCCNTRTLPSPLHLKKKEKNSAQFTKIRLPTNILSGMLAINSNPEVQKENL